MKYGEPLELAGSNNPRTPEKEQLTIIIEQGTVVSFWQRMLYPSLEGVCGEGI